MHETPRRFYETSAVRGDSIVAILPETVSAFYLEQISSLAILKIINHRL